MISSITKAEMIHLDDCVIALQNSELGMVYFSEENKAAKAITEGILKEQVLVALDDTGLCVGFLWYALYGAFHSFPYIHIIAIKKEYRGQGIGQRLLKHFESNVVQSSKVFLVVSDFNPKAKALYERIGYKEVGVLPNLYKDGVNEHLMMKEL